MSSRSAFSQLGRQQIIRITQVFCTLLILLALLFFIYPTDLRSRASSFVPWGSAGQTRESWDGWSQLEYHFIFGDSYSDQAFDVTQAQPSHANPFGNPEWMLPLSSGSNWVHFAGLTHNDSYVRTFDFAVGGSTIDPAIVAPFGNFAPASLVAQMETKFTPLYADRSPLARWRPAKTLFSLMFGINDIAASCVWQKHTPIERIFESYSRILDELYRDGARNFLFLNVPPFYRNYLDSHKQAGATLMVADTEDWNDQLAVLRNAFVAQHADVTAFLFDTWKLYDDLVQDPTICSETAKLQNTTIWCEEYSQGTPAYNHRDAACNVAVDEYFWLNNLHPTYPVHNATAARIVSDCFGPSGRKDYCS